MKTYHGERTERGCEVTVDGEPLRHRSDLSGNATSTFDWGFVGTGQLSIALLSDFLGDDPKAKAMYEAFEKAVVADLPHGSWTLTGQDLVNALAPLAGVGCAIAPNESDAEGAVVGGLPARPANIAPPADAGAARTRGTELLLGNTRSPQERAVDLKTQVMADAAAEIVNVAGSVAAAATAVSKAAQQVAHACDQPADESMSTANRAADQRVDATNRAVDAAAALARSAADGANRAVAKLLPKHA